MSSEKNIWIEIEYYKNTADGIYGCTANVIGSTRLVEIINELEIDAKNVISFKKNDKLLTKPEIISVFDWYYRKLKELEENEKRKKA